MRRIQSLGIHSIAIAAWMGLVIGTSGCQRTDSPEWSSTEQAPPAGEQLTEEDLLADEAIEPPETVHPLAENELDAGVVTTAGEVTARPVKTRSTVAGSALSATRTSLDDEEMEEGLDDTDSDEALAEMDGPDLKEGTPEYMLQQIALLKASPANLIRQPIPGKPGKFESIQLTPEQTSQEQLRRLHATVDLAMQVITMTKDHPRQEQLFNNAVHYLGDARKQLALAGEPDQAQLLSEDADALFKRDKTSFAAVQSALKLVQLAQAQAETYGRQDTRWGAAFAKQARLFAGNFPQETNLAAMNLIAAGRITEQLGLMEDSLTCYAMVEERFPNTPFADTTASVLRRLRLQGQKLTEFAGSTLEGGYISIDQFAGHPVLIAFWSANSQKFQSDLPLIEAALTKHGSRGLMVVGVNLDKNQATVDQFVEQHNLAWQNIFFSAAESRGVQNPIARHYGVTSVPVYWMVDARGTVVAAPFDIQQLDAVLSKTPTKSAQR